MKSLTQKMNLLLKTTPNIHQSKVSITGSKSETNRLLLLQALYPNISLENISNSDDSDVMVKAIKDSQQTNSDCQVIDIHHAGTAMRFLTAYFAVQEGKEVVLTGSSRMKERPITILVEALRQLGAQISYTEHDGYPPLKIVGKKLTQNKVTLSADVSSQFISALLLIAPKLDNGLHLTLEGFITSAPYIKMTLEILNSIGIQTSFENNVIKVDPQSTISNSKFIIESDWSSASYYYSIVALSPLNTEITLSNYKKNSLQGDAVLKEIYENFGVETTHMTAGIKIKKIKYTVQSLRLDLNATPDIAQTLVVTCFALGVACYLSGLHTLKIKETDRLEALKTELTRLGALVITSDSTIKLGASTRIHPNKKIKTYQDHRMAMAFAPLALKTPIEIQNAEVVSKSYPSFWNDLKNIGFQISEQKAL